MSDLSDNWGTVRRRVEAACLRAGRPFDAVRLIAVSKAVSAARLAAVAACGQRAFGESYLQEALPKIGMAEDLVGGRLDWHFIGPIQANKTAAIAAHFAWAHGVDRERVARRLDEQRSTLLAPINICVQVNISAESTKSGCNVEDAPALCAALSRLPRLRLRGLMAIPAAAPEAEISRPAFRQLRELFVRIRSGGAVDPAQFDTLSMGMSDDYEVAIEEGATLLRIGSAIFGERNRK